MIQRLSKKLACSLHKAGVISTSDEIEICAYGYEHILSDLLQTLLLFLLAVLFHALIPVLMYTVFFGSLKTYIGGWHCSSHGKCFFLTTFSCFLVVYAAHWLPVWIAGATSVLTLILVALYAPIPHQNKPLTEAEYHTNKRKATTTAALQMVILLACLASPFRSYAIYGSCGQTVAVLSLMISKRKEGKP